MSGKVLRWVLHALPFDVEAGRLGSPVRRAGGTVIRVLPFVVELALVVFCLIDCIQTDESEARNLGKGWWILLILVVPLIGAIAWLVAGRPVRRGPRRQVPWPSTATAGFPEYERPRRAVGPDDDPEFLAEMRRGNQEQERLLRAWEDDLRKREQALRGEGLEGGDPDRGDPGVGDGTAGGR